MPTIPDQILQNFQVELEKSEEFAGGLADRLVDLLRGDKKLKAEELVKVLATQAGPGVE